MLLERGPMPRISVVFWIVVLTFVTTGAPSFAQDAAGGADFQQFEPILKLAAATRGAQAAAGVTAGRANRLVEAAREVEQRLAPRWLSRYCCVISR
jgi:hypothetical protein